MKENNELNKDYREKKYEDKNYDERNEYDFYIKYFLHFAIGTKYEDCIEITKQEYKELKKILRKSTNAMVEVFATYAVGFYQDAETYVIKEVDKDVYYCLFNSQRYEKNKRRHELERHIDCYFKQDNIKNLVDIENVENKVIRKIESELIRNKLKLILTKKQIERLYKNFVLGFSLSEIAQTEDTDAAAILRSIERAIKNILKNF